MLSRREMFGGLLAGLVSLLLPQKPVQKLTVRLEVGQRVRVYADESDW